jgi:hypothetical protein
MGMANNVAGPELRTVRNVEFLEPRPATAIAVTLGKR